MKSVLKRVGSELAERWGPERLDTVTFALTYRCNLACKTCGSWVKGRDPSLRELAVDDVLAVVDQLPDLRVRNVFLVGSEVLLFDGYLDVLRRVRGHGIPCSLLTNASLVDAEAAEGLMSAHPTTITVSLDGDEATHDKLRGSKSYRRAMAGLEHLTEARHRLSAETALGVHLTISRFNAECVRPVADLCQERGWNFSVQAVSYTPKEMIEASSIDGEPAATNRFLPRSDFGLRREDVAALRRTHEELLAQGRFFSSLHLIVNLPEEQLLAGKFPVGPCQSIRHELLIEPDGRVIVCANVDAYTIGNVTRESLREVWESERRRQMSRTLGNGGLSVCQACCNYTQNVSIGTLVGAGMSYLQHHLAANRARHHVSAP